MPSAGILRPVDLVRTDVSEEHIASIIRVTRVGELGVTLAVTSNQLANSFHPDSGGDTFRRNVGSYKNHTA
jgi:hypothetical protein